MERTVDLASLGPVGRSATVSRCFHFAEAKAVTVDQSPVAALANASEITGLPRDNFEVYEISKEEFEGHRA
jgi:hypothetical protein